MQTGLIMLCLAYLLSQFFRAFLAVLATFLERDLGAGADDLAFASGLWFLSFALMQLPLGWLLDRSGPRRTASALLLLGGGGGAALFALATTPAHVSAAMFLIGIGCAPCLMASYYIFAREYPPAKFATLGSLMLGVGSLGNLIASYPVALAAETIGWRASLWSVSALSVLVALGIFLKVRDPAPSDSEEKGTVLDLLKMPVMWAILALMFVMYAPTGAVRGLWIGPYLSDVFGLAPSQIGTASLIMGISMIIGTLTFGPLDRIFGTRKWVIFAGNFGSALTMLALAFFIGTSATLSIAIMATAGFLGGTYAVMIAHGRAFCPPHLVGRGVTLVNLAGIGGVGVMQFVSGRIHETMQGTATVTAPYATIFAFFGLALLAGSLIFLFARDNVD
ncbi:MAG: MFS transporter [Heliomarina sp.]|uniref:MFS transporter n=1 Tax=Heliomarina sp. TaxID=2917556 RepID=UPI004059ACCA